MELNWTVPFILEDFSIYIFPHSPLLEFSFLVKPYLFFRFLLIFETLFSLLFLLPANKYRVFNVSNTALDTWCILNTQSHILTQNLQNQPVR